MQGTVLEYNAENNKGHISGHDGNRYHFTTDDWVGEGKIKKGMEVDFDVDEQDGEKACAVLSAAHNQNHSSKWKTVLGWILGIWFFVAGIVQFANGLLLIGIGAWTASALTFPPINKIAHDKTGMTIKPGNKIGLVIFILLLIGYLMSIKEG